METSPWICDEFKIMNPSNSNPHLVQPFRHWRRWLLGLLGFVVAFLVFCWWEARLPNETLTFSRETISKLELARLAPRLEDVSQWKTWFHSVKDVRVVDSQNHPLAKDQQKAHDGALLEIEIDPGKQGRRHFQLAARIRHFEPGKLLEIEILDDSSGRLTRVFDQLNWKIELTRNSETQQWQIIGTETAHTAHWRSRLFGRLAPRILLNQVFYPDLLVLANPEETPPKADGMF
jgi:hypothetical protein